MVGVEVKVGAKVSVTVAVVLGIGVVVTVTVAVNVLLAASVITLLVLVQAATKKTIGKRTKKEDFISNSLLAILFANPGEHSRNG